MIAKAQAKYVRSSPTKVKPVVDVVKGQPVGNALAMLHSVNKKAAKHIERVLKSAASNAKNKGFKEETLFVSKIVANSGPVLKRYRAATFGRASLIRKRTSHIVIEHDTKEKPVVAKTGKKKTIKKKTVKKKTVKAKKAR